MLKKSIFKAALVIIIALAMVIPATAITTKTKDITIPAPAPKTTNRDVLFQDDFESYTDFVIDFPPWTNIDTDGSPTFGSNQNTWTNEWLPQAFIIMNPSMTSPAWTDPLIQPHGGSKFAACFNDNNAGYINDDWMITPQLGPATYDSVTFWAKAFNNQYDPERFTVCVSTTDTNPASFTMISPAPYVMPPYTAWTQYTYSLAAYSGQHIYVGIHCVTTNGWCFMVDDFQVTGQAGADTTPPVTTCTLTGTMNGTVYISDVTVTLTATDDGSGVNYTRYKLDDSDWAAYTVPFVVSANGAHTVLFYSVDIAGNQEAQKTSTFTIQKPVALIITIKGGFGISAVINNTGTTDLTNVGWTINLNGGFILLGKTKSGEIPSIAAGAQVTVKDLVFGFGKPTITVTAGTASGTATGTVLLFFVLGVK